VLLIVASVECLVVNTIFDKNPRKLYPLPLQGCAKGSVSATSLRMNNHGGADGEESKKHSNKDDLSVKPKKLPILPLVTIVLACTRPIPVWDRFFSIGYPVYLCLANHFRFDRNAPGIAAGKVKTSLLREGQGPWFKIYMATFGIIGIVLPFVVQIVAPRSIADAAAPHLYLTLCQIVMETLTRGPHFYPLMQLMVPIGFNAYRLISLKTWLITAWRSTGAVTQGGMVWEALGLALAFVNTVVWTYNLFVFLLLRTLPQYINRDEFPEAKVSWNGQVFPILNKKSD